MNKLIGHEKTFNNLINLYELNNLPNKIDDRSIQFSLFKK